MLGLGEKEEEILDTMDDLIRVGCSIMTIGQYLQPTKDNRPLKSGIRTSIVTPGHFSFSLLIILAQCVAPLYE